MRLSLTFAALVAAVPAFVNAVPSRSGTIIPLTKRGIQLANDQGIVNADVLKSLGTKTSGKLNRAFAAYEKNTGEPHPLSARVSIDLRRRDAGSGSIPLTEKDEVIWYGPIAVGTPQQDFTVVFDTGSSDLFLPGATCGDSCKGHKIYDTSTSSTASDLNKPFTLKYGDGSSVEGEVYTDTVILAGLTATNQSVGAASEYSTQLSPDQFPSDGLMGMAFPQISVYGTQPFFQNLVDQGGVVKPQFSVKLAADGSELFLGGANSKLFTGDFTTLDVTKEGFWQVSLGGVNVGGKPAFSNAQAIIDTGTSLIVAPEQDVADFYKAIPGSKNASSTIGPGFFTYPCNSDPKVSLTFGGKEFPVSGFNVGQAEAGSSDCVGGIMATNDSHTPFWIVGDIFLSGVYTRFDTGAKQVGFADLV